MSDSTTPRVGIESIGMHIPPLALPVEELAKLRGEDPNKYTVGLGCSEMAVARRTSVSSNWPPRLHVGRCRAGTAIPPVSACWPRAQSRQWT